MKFSLWLTLSVVLWCGHRASTVNDQLAPALTPFSQDLYRQIGLANKSVVYSPYSVHSALTMTLAGARGETATEMTSTLKLTTVTNPHAVYRSIIQRLNQCVDVAVEVANGLYLSPFIPVKTSFIEQVKGDYYAMADNFDLSGQDPPEKKINDFVAEKTNDVIQSILPANSINGDTIAVLINTLFFNGTWEFPFEQRHTSQQSFHTYDGTVVQVDMMSFSAPQTLSVAHDSSVGVDILELPFTGRQFSLFIVVTRTQDVMDRIELSASNLLSVTSMLDGILPTYGVQVKLPKFKIETEADLKEPLRNMGMARAFDAHRADFSGITSSPAYIGQVLHKAVIDVQETGTVASAATAVVISREMAFITNEVFTVDRPFFFFLKEKSSNLILFQGKYTGP